MEKYAHYYLGEVLDALKAERHQLAGLEGAGHPLVRRVEVPLAEAAEVDVDLPFGDLE